ncbi:2'-5' RNA ligase family protein [Sphingomicrobium sediminis]|uniref:2'-5' RNA ligase family protein n=1 Tax=Sphingomicrobium sediminis TaxID=2950949 RepID=A0A9X2J0Y3_9SPHN|nr:2'-5' RNA ligase family protein [Sphingomicrobium sediminis]MCM8556718.1 2'-5' RNA ligase family protein [Sphingomicrobium sediminis]
MTDTRPLIVTAAIAPEDLGWLDAERRAHFPEERNLLTAHLTMFHALPPSMGDEAASFLARLARDHARPDATLSEVMSLGRGVAYRVRSDGLVNLREMIAEHFHGCLTAQDAGGWRPHITIQNKVTPKEAKALLVEKQAGFEPRPLRIAGLSLDRYDGGPWEKVGTWKFSGSAKP